MVRPDQPVLLTLVLLPCSAAFALCATPSTPQLHGIRSRAGLPVANALPDDWKPDDEVAKVRTAEAAPTKDVGIDWIVLPSGVKYVDEVVGQGAEPADGQVVACHYTVSLLSSGTELGTTRGNQPLRYSVGRHQVPFWDDEVLRGPTRMRVGGKRRLIVPPDAVPQSQSATSQTHPGRTLRVDVELVELVEEPAGKAWGSFLWPAARRVSILRTLFALSFVPYFFPEDIKPDAWKARDPVEIGQARLAKLEATDPSEFNSRYLGGDIGVLDELFPPEAELP